MTSFSTLSSWMSFLPNGFRSFRSYLAAQKGERERQEGLVRVAAAFAKARAAAQLADVSPATVRVDVKSTEHDLSDWEYV